MADPGTAPQLRPLGLGEILDAALKVYTRNFKTLCLAVLVPVVPIVILTTLVTASASSAENAFDPTAGIDPASGQSTFSGAEVAGFAVTALLTLLLTALATAACTRAVADAYIGEPTSWRASLRFALRKLLPVIVVSILVVLLATVSLLALLIGAVYVGVRLTLSSPALLIEDLGPVAAMRRSWALVKERWWFTFGIFVISTLLVTILSLLVQGLLLAPLLTDSDNEVLGGILTSLGSIVANVFTLPIQAAVITILYFDLRVRKEGLDLELLARDIGAGSPAAVGRSAGLGTDPPGGFAPPQVPGGFTPPQAPGERGPS